MCAAPRAAPRSVHGCTAARKAALGWNARFSPARGTRAAPAPPTPPAPHPVVPREAPSASASASASAAASSSPPAPSPRSVCPPRGGASLAPSAPLRRPRADSKPRSCPTERAPPLPAPPGECSRSGGTARSRTSGSAAPPAPTPASAPASAAGSRSAPSSRARRRSACRASRSRRRSSSASSAPPPITKRAARAASSAPAPPSAPPGDARPTAACSAASSPASSSDAAPPVSAPPPPAVPAVPRRSNPSAEGGGAPSVTPAVPARAPGPEPTRRSSEPAPRAPRCARASNGASRLWICSATPRPTGSPWKRSALCTSPATTARFWPLRSTAWHAVSRIWSCFGRGCQGYRPSAPLRGEARPGGDEARLMPVATREPVPPRTLQGGRSAPRSHCTGARACGPSPCDMASSTLPSSDGTGCCRGVYRGVAWPLPPSPRVERRALVRPAHEESQGAVCRSARCCPGRAATSAPGQPATSKAGAPFREPRRHGSGAGPVARRSTRFIRQTRGAETSAWRTARSLLTAGSL
jgi:hypothetical protein